MATMSLLRCLCFSSSLLRRLWHFGVVGSGCDSRLLHPTLKHLTGSSLLPWALLYHRGLILDCILFLGDISPHLPPGPHIWSPETAQAHPERVQGEEGPQTFPLSQQCLTASLTLSRAQWLPSSSGNFRRTENAERDDNREG